jgi:nitrate reductase NapAB chaperone NapD
MSKRKRLEKIVDRLDLGWSDFYYSENKKAGKVIVLSENVRERTLQEKLDRMESATEVLDIDESMNYSIFDKKGAKHPSAQIYAVDFPSDLRASIYLLLGGYYRQAILCLRNWLEMRLTGIYFGFINLNRRHYREWKKGKKRAPIGRDLIKKLFSRAEFHKVDKKFQLRERLGSLHGELSAFTHGAILEKYNLQSETDNVPRFNPQSVDIWCDFVVRVLRELVFCYFLAYGQDAFILEAEEREAIRRFLPKEYLEELGKKGILS